MWHDLFLSIDMSHVDRDERLPQEVDACGRDAARVSLYAAVLGASAGISGTLGLVGGLSRPLSLYTVALANFHLLEYWTTARFNPDAATSESFLLWGNGAAYWLAQATGILELVLRRAWPKLNVTAFGKTRFAMGLAMMVLGQLVRSTAMCQAGVSFSHLIARRKQARHVLVSNGIYSRSRHPSYAGFFYFAIGTQVMLGNTVSTALFTAILWRFFSRRIREEETYLLQFFGDDYVRYRASVATMIPGIR